ncbi:MAG: amidohydrolase family protein [Acidobacteria bacterium]|nr:amidohydrolase family protein [Acidobacteriota bacterium]
MASRFGLGPRLLTLVLSSALFALPAAASAQAADPPTIVIVGASVVNLDGGPAVTNAAVIIAGDRIVTIGPAASTAIPQGAEVIRANGRWIVPGLMNMHTHYGLVLPGRQGAELAGESEAALALRMAANARMSLMSGVTTTRSTGESRGADYALRRAIARGEVVGPRIFTAGETLNVTGGHGWGIGEEGLDSPEALRRAVRRRAFDGAEWIKIAISGGIADTHGDIAASHMTREEVAAVTDMAHRHGMKVTAHSGSPGATLEAIEAGLDCVEHGYFLTDEVLTRMADKGVWLVPTIVVAQRTVMEFFKKIGSPDWYLDRVASVGESHFTMLRSAIKHKVRIALGTDQFPYEPNDKTTATIREAQYYVEAGMTPLQALRSATIETATMLGIEDRAGSVQQGKLADLIITDADPSKDITALRGIKLVMKGGVVYRNELAREPR